MNIHTPSEPENQRDRRVEVEAGADSVRISKRDGSGTSYRLQSYTGARTTYRVEVARLAEPPDVKSIGDRFAARETQAGGMKPLSVRATVRAGIGNVTFEVDYSRPLARAAAGRRNPSLRSGVANRCKRSNTIHDVGADHSCRVACPCRHIHSLDDSPHHRDDSHREQTDGAMGNGLQSRA